VRTRKSLNPNGGRLAGPTPACSRASGRIDRSSPGGTSRLDATCTLVSIGSWAVTLREYTGFGGEARGNGGVRVLLLYFKKILNERCGCASYVIASRKTGEAAVVDPASETEPYDALLRGRELRLRYVIDTHIHADHISGARRLAASQGAELCLHESARTAYPF